MAPKTEAEWRAQPGPWAHLTKEQTDDFINTMVAKERERCVGVLLRHVVECSNAVCCDNCSCLAVKKTLAELQAEKR